LSVELGPRPVPVRGDETRLTQLVDNLLNNATKFTDAGGSVVLQVMGDATEAVLTVCDNGVGMPASLLTSAFDPFVQGSHTLARSDGGLGIGLALVKRIAELHDGRVNARSGGPGQGACFTVRLPLTREPLPQPSPPAGAVGTAAASTRVLVVDDNRDAAESLAALLELEGFTVRTVHDGRAALAAAQSWQPHSVVLDIGLPEMDGYQVATALRAQLADRAPHLIALTGYGQAADRERTRAAGFERHLIKPVEHAELVAALQGEAPAQAHLDATRSQR
jgi:CheY-like chemotaxis protein